MGAHYVRAHIRQIVWRVHARTLYELLNELYNINGKHTMNLRILFLDALIDP